VTFSESNMNGSSSIVHTVNTQKTHVTVTFDI